jgi:hypothetical protein
MVLLIAVAVMRAMVYFEQDNLGRLCFHKQAIGCDLSVVKTAA